MIYGYAKGGVAGLTEADVANQVAALKKSGAQQVLVDRNPDELVSRDKLLYVLDSLRNGDTLMCSSVCMLCPHVAQFLEIADLLRQNALRLVILNGITLDFRRDPIDASTQAYMEALNTVNELVERNLRMREHQGQPKIPKKIGRPRIEKGDIPPTFLKHYAAYREGKLTVSELARVTCLSRPTVYKYIRLLTK